MIVPSVLFFRFSENFGNAQHFQFVFQVFHLDRIGEHLGAVGTGHGDDPRAGFQGFPDAHARGAVFARAQNIRKEVSAASAAAKGVRPFRRISTSSDRGWLLGFLAGVQIFDCAGPDNRDHDRSPLPDRL